MQDRRVKILEQSPPQDSSDRLEYAAGTQSCLPITSHLCSNCCMDQNRYREFMRVTRMWRNIQNLMQFGFGHDSRKVQPGELALFCATCPQPGINLPEDWADDPEE
jgi:hypothetical protein